MSFFFWSIKTFPRSSKSCNCVNNRILKYLPTFPFYSPHCHMIFSKQKFCLWFICVSTGCQKHTSVLQTKWVFSHKKYDSYKCWTCAELCEAFTFLMENIYVQYEGKVYQQIVGIPSCTHCTPLIADLFLSCYERDFMSNLYKSKQCYLIDITLNLRTIFLIYIQ